MAYWISGRSTKVMISLGIDFVAGRNRVPIPATGKTAFVTFLIFIFPTLSKFQADLGAKLNATLFIMVEQSGSFSALAWPIF
jgi:hypothetical protein